MAEFAIISSRREIRLFSSLVSSTLLINSRRAPFTVHEADGVKILRTDFDLSAYDEVVIKLSDDSLVVAYPVELIEESGIAYDGWLGYRIEENAIILKAWAPGPHRLYVELFESCGAVNSSAIVVPMALDKETGVWSAEIDRKFLGCAYRYRIERFGKTIYSPDPYAPAATANGELSFFLKLDEILPEDWEDDDGPKLESSVDAVIYEVHIKDLSTSWTAGFQNRGNFLSLSEEGVLTAFDDKAGIAHIRELGATHIQLLPVQDFGSVDEADTSAYNWGYDPVLYNVPEGSYSTDPYSPERRVLEFRQLVKTVHKNGLGVILDVVYNHTYVTDTPFNRLVPYYYYRLNQNGEFSNGSGCGNELAAERIMVRKFIIDSLKHWVEDYHVDGFRFDLMALLGKNTILEIERELKKLRKDILLYGEPWVAASSSMKDVSFAKGEQRNTNVAVFNDDLRNALKGYPDDKSRGFVSGERGWETGVVRGMLGEIDYSHVFKGFAARPTETVNYASAHDNLTLYDKLIKSVPEASFEERKRMAALALSIILTSQGIAFIHAGSEMLRTKLLEENSYRSGCLINELNYLQKRIYGDFYEYVRGLVALRKRYALFRLRTAEEIKEHAQVLHIADGFVSIKLRNDREEILVAHNARNEAISLNVGETWKLLVYDCKIDLDGQRKAQDTIKVERMSTTVAIKTVVGCGL